MERNNLPKIAFFTLTAGFLALSQGAGAHTSLETKLAAENTRVNNKVQIGHGCEDNPVIANSVVFPDGWSSTIKINNQVVPGAHVDRYLSWEFGGLVSHTPSNDVFQMQSIKWDRQGEAGENPVGNQSWDGELPAHSHVGLVPIRTNAGSFVAESCAKSVTFKVAIADICKITTPSGFNAQTVNFWSPVVGSIFDPAEDESANFTITRDLEDNPLPQKCGAGFNVEVYPTANQLNHDLPIPGVWPAK